MEKCLLVQEMGATDPEKVKMVLTNMETFMPKVRITCFNIIQFLIVGEVYPSLRISGHQLGVPGHGCRFLSQFIM